MSKLTELLLNLLGTIFNRIGEFFNVTDLNRYSRSRCAL
jgi:hypothetical protein